MYTYVNVSIVEPGEMECTTVFNITKAFPSCDISGCVCENGTFADVYSCLPTVDCLYEDGSAKNLLALCSAEFLSLIGEESCPFGTLNNFQVLCNAVLLVSVIQYCHVGDGDGVSLGTACNCWHLCGHHLFCSHKSC